LEVQQSERAKADTDDTNSVIDDEDTPACNSPAKKDEPCSLLMSNRSSGGRAEEDCVAVGYRDVQRGEKPADKIPFSLKYLFNVIIVRNFGMVAAARRMVASGRYSHSRRIGSHRGPTSGNALIKQSDYISALVNMIAL
jgi:hypothetical protein